MRGAPGESDNVEYFNLPEWTGEEKFLGRVPPTSLRPICLLFTIVFVVFTAGVQSVSARNAVKIENVGLVPPQQSQLNGGVRIEGERTLIEDGAKYSNTRFRAVDYRMGVLDNFELQLGFNHSSNSAENAGAPNGSGIEGIRLGGKLQWHPNISTTLTGTFNGSDNVYPYGQDDPSFSVNVPIKFQLGEGVFHGEAGLTLQSGDAMTPGGQVGTWDDYLNYGIGYAYEVNQFSEMSIEVVGHSATISPNTGEAEDHLELILGNGIRLAPDVRVKPSLGFALMDGSPGFSVGVNYEIGFGGRRLPRPDDGTQPEERFSTRNPVGGISEEEPEETTDRRMEEPTERRETREGSEEPSQNEKVNNLMNKAYNAAENDNPQKAIRLYEEAEQLDPENVLIQSNLGSLYYRQGNYKQAIENYRKAVKNDPEDTFSLLYLGASHYQLGNRRAARRYFQEVRRLDPDNQRVQEWLQEMKN